MRFDLLGPAIFWVAALLKMRLIADRRQRPIIAALLLLAIGLTFDVDSVARGVDRELGIANLSILLKHGSAVLGVYFLLMFMRQVAGEPARTRAAAATLGVVLIGLVVSFALAGPLPETLDLATDSGHVVMVRVFWLITIGYFAICLWSLLRLALGTARNAGRQEVRLGFSAVTLGVAVGVAYSVVKIIELLAGSSRLLAGLASSLLVAGSLLIGGGFLYPVAASVLRSISRQFAVRRLLVQLRPAWCRSIEAAPAVVLGRPPSRMEDVLGRGAQPRLYRRIIEIQDAALEHHHIISPRVQEMLDEAELRALVQPYSPSSAVGGPSPTNMRH